MGRNWQLLGEVPDSDDEDINSQESLGEAQPEQDAVIENLSDREDEPVATIPKSLPSQRPFQIPRQNTPSPFRSPVPRPFPSSLPAADSDDEIDLVDDGVHDIGKNHHSQPRTLPHDVRHETVEDKDIWEFDDKHTPQIEVRTVSQEHDTLRKSQISQQPASQSSQLSRRLSPSPISRLSQPLRTPLSPRQSQLSRGSQTPRETRQPEPPHERVDPFAFSPSSSLSSLSRSPSPVNDAPAPRSSAHRAPSPSFAFPIVPDSPPTFRLGFVRSLRPRKPIQQHPYLLENAQYAQAMKSHGVKPVRTEHSNAPRKQVVDEDSQEQESQGHESQVPAHEQNDDLDFLGDSLYDFPASPTGLRHSAVRSSLSPSTSTPAHRLMPLSSQDKPDDGTDNTSLPDEDDFPNAETFMLQRRRRQLDKASRKRHSSPKKSSAAKRARTVEAALPEGTPPPKWIPVPIDSSPDPLPRSTARTRLSGSTSLSPPVSLPAHRTTFTISDDESEDEAEGSRSSQPLGELVSPARDEADEIQNDLDTVRRNSRRIKGVLPASWLRLDQAKAVRASTSRPSATQRRSRQQNDNPPRKGVALPRQGTTTSSFTALAPIFDESDDDNNNNDHNNNIDDNDHNADHVSILPRVHRPELWPEDDLEDDGDLPVYQIIDDADVGSVMEADIIDRMGSGPKRSRLSTTWDARPKKLSKKRTLNHATNAANQKTRQPKITRMFDRSASSSTASNGPSRKQTSSGRTKSRGPIRPGRLGMSGASRKPSSGKARRPSSSPPLLSILDFVEPEAPNFIRVAARTARSKPRQGKASPSRKIINLGSRADNVDALSVLHDWRAGNIRPKILNPPRQRPPTQREPALQDLSPNLPRLPSNNRAKDASAPDQFLPDVAAAPSKKRQSKSFVNKASQAKSAPQRHPTNRKATSAAYIDSMARPAQLETAARAKQSTSGFIAKKRALDDMYRRRRKEEAIVLPNVRLEKFVDDQKSNYGPVDDFFEDAGFEPMSFEPEQVAQQPQPQQHAAKATPETAGAERRSRFRKRYNPRPVDTSAPRFVHALDPLTVDIAPVTVDLVADAADPEADKLRGLGLFGSEYSQHFDIFPLDSGIFFHHSTLIGSGRLAAAVGTVSVDSLQAAQAPTPISSFQLDERILSWTAWDDVSSSEFGILLDWLADSLLSPNASATVIGPKVHALVNFLLDFIQNAICAPTAHADIQKAFVFRSLEVITSFIGRFESSGILQRGAQAIEAIGNSHLASLTGLLVVASWLLRICREAPERPSYVFQVEDMLTKAAKVSVKTLLKHDLSNVRSRYGDLQRPILRDRGIRRDMQALCSWVALMQVLEYAQIPRSGFWDVTYSVLLADQAVNTCTNASHLERLWEDMFTLLPLTEFDSYGVIQPGLRQSMPLDGWELPRKALDRVFQLYKANPHQSPSFNAYCRAIVGRCHYLVQEWGWRRCKNIVGTIFDFYGSQDFAHLRNEEVYASPRFLEELTGAPSLRIEPEDKCFHIFIKMLGLVILQLKRLGLTKEMTNLVSRILPNHDRQYLKEMDVHQRDLAALRNHHDLLCTLFWAASPEARPPIHQIEKLVVPANSHKEACLINIRAWNQLARFVIASNEGHGVYKGFSVWMRNIFQQMLEQYMSAESDMHRQFQNLSKSMMQGIDPDMVKAMAAANRAAAMDVLQACVVSSLDVLKHATSLGVATYCFNTDQLDVIFSKIDLPSGKTNWGIFRTALDVVDHYMDRVEKAIDQQYSYSSDTGDSDVAAEAVMMLDHKLARSFFRLNKAITHMSWEDLPRSVAMTHVACTESSVVLAARLASRFIHSGVYSLSRFFGSSGDCCIFERLPHAPGLMQRRFLPLFVSAMIDCNVFDFKDLGTSILELWMLAIVKPQQFLAYENRLAGVLQRHDLPYVRRAYIPTNGQAPNYDTNRAFFACAMASMRQQLRDGDGDGASLSAAAAATRRQQLRSDFARALKLVMQQMKEDLKYALRNTAAPSGSAQHEKYIAFVRGIVALIRSHGSDICMLDKFFYDQSLEYSPSPEDPHLQTASIVTYGLRLGEGEATAAPQLFHYLHNNFNIALANGELDQECNILERSMENNSVMGFMLERMLPAILRATAATDACWPLLDVYCSAVEQFLTRSYVPKDIGDENVTRGVVGLFEDIVAWLQWAMATTTNATESAVPIVTGTQHSPCVRVHTMAQLAALANVLQPFIMTCLCMPCAPATLTRLDSAISTFCEYVKSAMVALEGLEGQSGAGSNDSIDSIDNNDNNEPRLFPAFQQDGTSGVYSGGSSGPGDLAQMDSFSKKVVQHVRDNWAMDSEGNISVQRLGFARVNSGAGGSAGQGASSGSRVPFGPWTMKELLGELQRQLRLWKVKPAGMYGMVPRERRLFPGRLRGLRTAVMEV